MSTPASMSDLHQLGAHGLFVGQIAADAELDAGHGSDVRVAQRDAAGQTRRHVDIEPVVGDDAGHHGDLAGRQSPPQHGDDAPFLALLADPLLVVVGIDGREVDVYVEAMGLVEQILEHRGRLLGRRDLDEHAERDIVVDHRLADVEHIDIMLGQQAGNAGDQTRAVAPGHVDENDFVGQEMGFPCGAAAVLRLPLSAVEGVLRAACCVLRERVMRTSYYVKKDRSVDHLRMSPDH